MALAILGVTGFTGRLVLDEARRSGLDVRLVGRRRDALDALAAPGEEVRVADAAQVGRGPGSVRGLRCHPLVCRAVSGDRAGAGARRDRSRRPLSRHERRAGVGEAPARAGRERRSGARAGLRLRLRAGRHRGAAGRRAGRGAARRDRRRLLGQGRRHEPGHAADDRPCDRAEAGRLGGRPARSVRVRRDDPPVRFPFGERRSSSGAGPSRSRCRATPTSAMCARTSARRPSPAGWEVSAGWRRPSCAPLALRPVGAVRGVAGQEQVHRRRRGAGPAAKGAPSSRGATSTA